VLQNCKGFSKPCIFLVGSSQKRFIDLLEENLIVLKGEGLILDHYMFNFKLLVYFLLLTLISFGPFAYFQYVLLDNWVKLPLEDGKDVAGTDETIAIVIV
jgi:hypothetical protein